ncbi:Xaa-Pro aminopeptidase [Caldisphaera lagunensis DSM 15908]|uniref:Xaa-Pro aminopeptidase n=1 Tax=Caldisphaera lagunensis (strain DSM 15908 / JCM 11604 / ANMR 0165 / IC-154) TaxID=1056495 RepID=L0ABY9_CALLD|nr:Xaa-Pro aminopeptidase [Caldisphaera lagunensis DSM 15908]
MLDKIKENYDAVYLTNPTNIFYLTNVSIISTERPFALIIPVNGSPIAFSPSVEKNHIEYRNSMGGGIISNFYYYFDYPGEVHPLNKVVDLIKELKIKSIALDNPLGANPIWGYKGPNLSELLKKEGINVGKVEDLINEMRLIKSEEEIELIRESGKWASRAIRVAMDLIQENKWDWEIAIDASKQVLHEMNKNFSPYLPLRESIGLIVGFRGQVGEFSSYPHALVSERAIRKGDVLGIGSGPEIGGYYSELERTLIYGKPSEKVLNYFNKMLELRKEAFDTLRPNIKASDVDKAVMEKAKKLKVEEFIRHHTGHGLGLEGHEPPFLDVGYDVILKPGMVVSIEPGIYNDYGGFRHSDTVLITKNGNELLTNFPDEDLII